MNIDLLVKDFKSFDVESQCACLIKTDYAALWPSLREYFKGPKVMMDQIIQLGCDNIERGKYCKERDELIAKLQLQTGPLRHVKGVEP